MTTIHIIHENPDWLAPLARVFDAHQLPFAEINLSHGSLDLSSTPPEGVFWSKMSASSYTRGNAHSPDYAFALMAWLEGHGRRVLNGSHVLKLELSKVEQYLALQQANIPTPRTIACFGREDILEKAKLFDTPFILKPNRGGKGIGVELIESHDELAKKLPNLELSVDHITLIQEYITSPESYITRMEFVGGRFVYAVKVDTSEGFELCPAEACRITPPAASSCALDADEGLFRILPDFDEPIAAQLEAFLQANRIDVAGVEFIRDAAGTLYVYDINTNTNYNPEAEEKAGVSAIPKLVDFLRSELDAV